MQCNDEAIIAYCEHVHSSAAYEKDSAKTPSSSLSAIVAATVRCSQKNHRENLFLGSENGKQILLACLQVKMKTYICSAKKLSEQSTHASSLLNAIMCCGKLSFIIAEEGQYRIERRRSSHYP